MTPTPLKFRKRRDYRFAEVRIRTQHGLQWVNTGQETLEKAVEVCDAAAVEKLQTAATLNILTSDVIARLTLRANLTFRRAVDEWVEDIKDRVAPITAHQWPTTARNCFTYLGLLDSPIIAPEWRLISQWVNVGALSTRQRRLVTIQSFFKWAYAKGLCLGDPSSLVRIDVRNMLVHQLEGRVKHPLTEEEYRLLMKAPKLGPHHALSWEPGSPRDLIQRQQTAYWRVIICLGFWTGLRQYDVVSLQWESIKEDRLVIYQQKTGRRVELLFSDKAICPDELRESLALIPRNDTPYCFPVDREKSVHPKQRTAFGYKFKFVLKQMGLYREGRGFHSLRHGCAQRLKALGRTREEIAAVLGHTHAASTDTYVPPPKPVLPDVIVVNGGVASVPEDDLACI